MFLRWLPIPRSAALAFSASLSHDHGPARLVLMSVAESSKLTFFMRRSRREPKSASHDESLAEHPLAVGEQIVNRPVAPRDDSHQTEPSRERDGNERQHRRLIDRCRYVERAQHQAYRNVADDAEEAAGHRAKYIPPRRRRIQKGNGTASALDADGPVQAPERIQGCTKTACCPGKEPNRHFRAGGCLNRPPAESDGAASVEVTKGDECEPTRCPEPEDRHGASSPYLCDRNVTRSGTTPTTKTHSRMASRIIRASSAESALFQRRDRPVGAPCRSALTPR